MIKVKQRHKLANYIGEIKNGRMEGVGTYYFESGTIYEGEFMDGMFHGEGVLIFPDGSRQQATWTKGKVDEGNFTFDDGLEFIDDPDLLTGWRYCNRVWDRRFHREIVDPTENSEDYVIHRIPSHCYDTGDGYYDPQQKTVFRYKDDIRKALQDEEKVISPFLRNVGEKEHLWILDKCRKGFDVIAGDLRKDDSAFLAEVAPIAGVSAAEKNGIFTEKYPSKKLKSILTNSFSLSPKESNSQHAQKKRSVTWS